MPRQHLNMIWLVLAVLFVAAAGCKKNDQSMQTESAQAQAFQKQNNTGNLSFPDIWTEDFDAAKTLAAEEGKDLLLDFTGSDWCGWCKKLDKDVFDTPAYTAEAPKHFVHVKLDYPNDESILSEATRKQNEQLKQAYQPNGYPYILLADAEGCPYAALSGYQAGGAENYLATLAELRQNKTRRDAAFAEAEKLEGIEKAKKLADALAAVGDDLALRHYRDTIDQINRLDALGQAGLSVRWTAAVDEKNESERLGRIVRLCRGGSLGGDLGEIIAEVDELLAPGFSDPAMRDMALFNEAMMLVMNERGAEARKITDDLITRPENFRGTFLDQMRRTHAWALCLTGDLEKGIALFEQVVADRDDPHWKSMNLGTYARAMQMVGETDLAITAYENAVAIAANAAVKANYQQQLDALKNGMPLPVQPPPADAERKVMPKINR